MPLIKRRESDNEKTRFSSAVPGVLQKIYAARGLSKDEDIDLSLQQLLVPNLKGLPEAVQIIADALQKQQSILIVGDFDCDGATSSAVAVQALRDMGAREVDFLVPNRFEYGYGLTPEIVEVAANCQPSLLITVDNGISSVDGVALANRLGMRVVVTDHHLAPEQLPDAAAIVNPNQPGCNFASKNLAGVGVIFYVMSALRAELRSRNWFQEQNIPEPKMADYLDLVALGTVADVVPLDKNNRILVAQGIARIKAGRVRPGIKALLDVAGRSANRLVSADFGFAIGPRLNAAGRLDDMSIGIRCLLAKDSFTADELAAQMNDLNHDRRSIETAMQREAEKTLQALSLNEETMPYGLCLYQGDWHQGVIGILASRIKDKYHRPTIVFADAEHKSGEEPEIKGSARSVTGLHIRDTLDAIATKHPQLLKKFGGHAMAAGMSLLKKDYQAFVEAFDQEVRKQLTIDDLQAVIFSDGELQAEAFNLALAQQLRDAGPWGQHFPEPVFDGEFQLLQQRIVGEKHLKMTVTSGGGEQAMDAIAFNVDVERWPDNTVETVRLAYRLDVNEFRGNQSLQLMVSHIQPV